MADQVEGLRYYGPCGCDDDNCRSFYTAPKPSGAYGPGHWNIMLEPPNEMLLVLDVIGEDIVFVEVLD